MPGQAGGKSPPPLPGSGAYLNYGQAKYIHEISGYRHNEIGAVEHAI